MADGDRLTFRGYKDAVLHALGSPDEADLTISPGHIVNSAIEHLAALHPWRWLSTGEVKLDLTADQDHVVLPADFGTLLAIDHQQSWSDRMIPTTWQRLLTLRQSAIESWSGGYFYVINTGDVTEGSEDAGLAPPTLNLYPTPATSEADAVRLVYRRFLRRMTADADVPQWPVYMDRALSLLARGFAVTDYDDAADNAYIRQFTQMVPDLIARDGLSQTSLGLGRGGLYPRTGPVSPLYTAVAAGIPDPAPA